MNFKGRRVGVCITVILISISLMGCMNEADYESYMTAVEKTDGIQKGVSEVNVKVESTVNLDLMNQLTPEEKKTFEQLENVAADFIRRYDNTKKQSMVDLFIMYNQLGTDIKLYQPSDSELYMKLPFLEGVFDMKDTMSYEQNDASRITNFTQEVASDWKAMLNVENIFVGEKTIIENEDGEVKSTKFTVKPTTAQLDAFMRNLRTAIIENKDDILVYLQEMQIVESDDELLDPDAFVRLVNELFDAITITRYEETAYVDLDGYIIDEKVIIELRYESSDAVNFIFNTQSIVIHHKNWDIEKDQQFDFEFLEQLERLEMDENTFMNTENDWSVKP